MCDLKYKELILRSSFDVNIFARFIIFQKDGQDSFILVHDWTRNFLCTQFMEFIQQTYILSWQINAYIKILKIILIELWDVQDNIWI